MNPIEHSKYQEGMHLISIEIAKETKFGSIVDIGLYLAVQFAPTDVMKCLTFWNTRKFISVHQELQEVR